MKWAPLFLLPSFAILVIFCFYPMISGFILSFQEWNGFTERINVGFSNYANALSDPIFLKAITNTLVYVIGYVPGTIVFSLFFAVLMNQKIKGKNVFRAIYYLPAITSGVSIALLFRWLYNTDFGLINITLYQLGYEAMIPWLSSSKYAMLSVIIMSVWKSLGSNIILMLAGIQAVPTTLHEAAEIDGANAFKRFFHITLPILSPTLFLVVIMSMIGAFQMFDTIMALTEGGPGNSTMVEVYYIYKAAFENFQMGYASAMAYILFAIIMLITLIQWIVKKKWVYSEIED